LVGFFKQKIAINNTEEQNLEAGKMPNNEKTPLLN
jgi:hypothetical protein